MPLLDYDTLLPVGVSPQADYKDPVDPTYSWVEIGAAASRDNSLVSLMLDARTRDQQLNLEAQPDYDVTAEDLAGYEDHADRLVWAKSPADLALMKQRVEDERMATEVLANSGWSGFAGSLAAGIIDPVNFIPVGGSLVKSAMLQRRVWESTKLAGRAGFVSSVASEAILQDTQMTRDLDQALTNIAAGTFLAGALGGGVGLIAGGERKALAEAFKDEVIDAHRLYHGTGGGQSVGAASASRRGTAEQESLTPSMGAAELGGGSESTIVGNPLTRMATSPSLETRRVGRELAEQTYIYKGEEDGIAGPQAVETRIKTWDGPLARAIEGIDRAFAEYRFAAGAKVAQLRAGIEDVLGQATGKLTYHQFKERVARAARRGDVDENPQVMKAAQAARKLFDQLKDEAIAYKLLPEGVTPETAISYVTRVYNTERIIKQRPRFENVLADWLTSIEQDLTYADARDIAADITDKILGNNGVGLYRPIPVKRGPLKERTLTIPDDAIEEFLDNDIERVLRIYKRTMAADVEMTKTFGSADLADAVDRIRESYKRVRDGVTDEKLLAKLQSTLESDIRDVEAIRDRLRGTYAIPKDPNGLIVRGFRGVRLLNYIRLGGGFTLGSIPDMGRHAMRHGMGRVMRTLIKPAMTEGKNFKLAREEVKLAGTALDWVLDTRAMAWADIGDDFGRNSKLERGVQYLGDKFGVVNVMSVWNATMKQWFGVMSQTRMLEAAEAIANHDGSRKELAYLAQLGIDEQMAYRIAEMATEHGDGFDVRWANTEAWQDREAVNAFRAAIVKDVDIGIVTPGQEKPLWMSTEFGKVVGQFRSFTVASMARVAARGLQQRDAATLQGLIMSVGLGMLVYRLKVPEEHIKWDDPAVWIKEGVDRAGVTGWIGEANNILEKWFANSVGISPLLGQEPTSRFDSRGAAGAVLGPSFGLAFDDPRQLAISMARGQWSAKDTHLLRKLLPYQNVFYLRWLFDHLEDDANDAFDIPDRRKAAKTNE